MKKIKVLAVTGIRSEFFILHPVISELKKDNRFEVRLIVCGAHLSDWHGNMLNEIESGGFTIADRIDSLFMTDRKTQRAKGVGILTYGISQTVEREKPDFLLYVGDREEAIATGIVGNYMDVLFAHIGGGDPVYGNADDPIRFAVSKLAHIHCTMAKPYADNLLRIGEEPFRVFFTGNPSLDNIRRTPPMSLEKLSQEIGRDLGQQKYIVFIQHPLSSEKEESESQIRISLSALDVFCREFQTNVIGIYPNTDPGSYGIVNAIKEYEKLPHFSFCKTLSREIFVNVMRHAVALVGNSSMGILEAPFYKLPVVNIGNRQLGRLNAGNVEFTPFSQEIIVSSLKKACFDKKYRSSVEILENPYGDGYSAQRIKDCLLSIDLNDKKWYVKKKLCG